MNFVAMMHGGLRVYTIAPFFNFISCSIEYMLHLSEDRVKVNCRHYCSAESLVRGESSLKGTISESGV